MSLLTRTTKCCRESDHRNVRISKLAAPRKKLSFHMHFVVAARDTTPKRIRQDIKAWCTRRLKEHAQIERENWWADRGSIRWIFKEDDIVRVVEYVNDAQDRKGRDR